MFNEYNEILKVNDVIQILRCSRPYVYDLIKNGDLEAWKATDNKTDPTTVPWRISKQSLINYVERLKGKEKTLP